MPLEIHPESHLDHNLSPAHVEWLLQKFADRDGFFVGTFSIPDHLPLLTCGLHGPAVGDPPVPENEVTYEVRKGRKCATRVVERELVPTRLVTIVAGPHDGKPCVLYTSYGGPEAPREPGDPSLSTWEDVQKSRAFWAEHALSKV